jgi:predicted lipid-binding transport protein (Tim44 family)
VEAEILEVRDVGSDREVTVLFDAVLRETQEARPAQVREVWHFIRSRNSRQPTWFLDGIQQLED